MSHFSSGIIKVTLSQSTPPTSTISPALQTSTTVSNSSLRQVCASPNTGQCVSANTSISNNVLLTSASVSNPSTAATPVVVIRSIGTPTGGTVPTLIGAVNPGVRITALPISGTHTPTATTFGSPGHPAVRLTPISTATGLPCFRPAVVTPTTSTATDGFDASLPSTSVTATSATAVPASSGSVALPVVVRRSPNAFNSPNVQQPNNVNLFSANSPQRHIIREMQVRVPNKPDKRFSVLRFHSADRLDLNSSLEVFMQRENNLRQFRSANNLTDTADRGGAGSEFGREVKQEARMRKLGIVRESYRPDDQPWLMTFGKGKSGRRRFRGLREGSVSDNVQYFVFCQCKDGNFDAYPVHSWYKMKPEINYRFLREDEAEVEYNRLHKTMNLFNVMIKRKLNEKDVEEEVALDREINKELKYLSVASDTKSRDADYGAPSSSSRISNNKVGARNVSDIKRGVGTSRRLKLTDLEELDGARSDAEEEEDEEDDAEGGAAAATVGDADTEDNTGGGGRLDEDSTDAGNRQANQKKLQKQLLKKKLAAAALVSRMRRGMKKRRQRRKKTAMETSSEDDDPNDEAQDDSEVDDHEGDEVDYMTNSSSDEEKLSEEERHRIYEETGVDEEVGLKTLLTDLSSDEEDRTVEKIDEDDADIKPDIDDPADHSNHSLLDRVKKEEPPDGRRGDPGTSGPESGRHPPTHRNRKKHKRHKKQRHKKIGDSDGNLSSSSSSSSATSGGAGGLSSSSSSGEDSSIYTSSSSSSSPSTSDSDLDDSDQVKSMSKPDKKHSVFQKLSDSIHANASIKVESGLESTSRITSGIKRQLPDTPEVLSDSSPSTSQPLSKKGRVETTDASLSTSSLTNFSTSPIATLPANVDNELKNTVRKYLMRKPITVPELLKKIRLRKLVGKNENPQTALANVLRQLRPIKQIINGQHALSLKH